MLEFLDLPNAAAEQECNHAQRIAECETQALRSRRRSSRAWSREPGWASRSRRRRTALRTEMPSYTLCLQGPSSTQRRRSCRAAPACGTRSALGSPGLPAALELKEGRSRGSAETPAAPRRRGRAAGGRRNRSPKPSKGAGTASTCTVEGRTRQPWREHASPSRLKASLQFPPPSKGSVQSFRDLKAPLFGKAPLVRQLDMAMAATSLCRAFASSAAACKGTLMAGQEQEK